MPSSPTPASSFSEINKTCLAGGAISTLLSEVLESRQTYEITYPEWVWNLAQPPKHSLQNTCVISLRYVDDTIRMAESKEELKSLLMKVKEESKRAGLKLTIQKTTIMAYSPITSW